jgi:tetraacyldisaccharide 4'-kinase
MIKKRSIVLYPISLLWGLVAEFRNFLYDSGILSTREFKMPVICVGNITVGGTGKTPHTEYLIGLLKETYSIAVLSRGYKRKSRGFRYVLPTSPVSDSGDEALQVAMKHPDITVAVDRNRVAGVDRIINDKPETEVIILDDGYQHRRITPGFTILLTSYERLITKDSLLPYGNLRESFNNINRAEVILVTKSPSDLSAIQRRIIVKDIAKAAYQSLYFTTVLYRDPQPVFSGTKQYNPDEYPRNTTGVLLLTGIADPAPLASYVSKFADELITLSFPDHHEFRPADLRRINDAFGSLASRQCLILTSEKDAARLREITTFAGPLKQAFHYIPIGIGFLNDDKDEFDNLIVDYVRRNNRVSQVNRDKRP